MPYNLTVRFEGLFLFVQRQSKNPGLYALLPHHPGHEISVVDCAAGTIEDDTKNVTGIIDWSAGVQLGSPQKIPGTISLKSATGGGTVQPGYLDDPPKKDLLTRIHLPFPEPGSILFPDHVGARADYTDGSPSTSLGTVAGVVILTFRMKSAVSVGKITVSKDAELRWYNAPPPAQRTRKPHGKDEHMHHSSAYLSLLSGIQRTPKFMTSTAYSPAPAGNDPCAALSVLKARGIQSIDYVDPVLCTVGGGCDPLDAACT